MDNRSRTGPPLRVVDSITQLSAGDAACLAVSGSHGGISSARYALAARPLLSVFNDAGVGLDQAGIAALPFLQSHGLAACTVSHQSARIGEAESTLAHGIISHVNDAGRLLGIEPGMRCDQIIGHFMRLPGHPGMAAAHVGPANGT